MACLEDVFLCVLGAEDGFGLGRQPGGAGGGKDDDLAIEGGDDAGFGVAAVLWLDVRIVLLKVDREWKVNGD